MKNKTLAALLAGVLAVAPTQVASQGTTIDELCKPKVEKKLSDDDKLQVLFDRVMENGTCETYHGSGDAVRECIFMADTPERYMIITAKKDVPTGFKMMSIAINVARTDEGILYIFSSYMKPMGKKFTSAVVQGADRVEKPKNTVNFTVRLNSFYKMMNSRYRNMQAHHELNYGDPPKNFKFKPRSRILMVEAVDAMLGLKPLGKSSKEYKPNFCLLKPYLINQYRG